MRYAIPIALIAALGLLFFLLVGERGGRSEPGRAPERAGKRERGTAREDDGGGTEPGNGSDAAPKGRSDRVHGIVVESGGEPLEAVRVLPQEWSDGRFREIGEAVLTGADGRFELDVVTTSPWVMLAASHERFQTGSSWSMAGNREEIRIELVRGAPVRLLVHAADGSPVGGADIRVQHKDTKGWFSLFDEGRHVTGEDGRVLLGSFGVGTIFINVDHAAHPRHRHKQAIETTEPIEIVVEMPRGGAVEGRVTGPDGEPVAGARVHARDDDKRVALTDEQGTYRLEPVLRAVVVAEHDEYGPGSFGEALGWGRAVPVVADPGETVTGIDIALDAAAFVIGRLIDDEGEGLPSIRLAVSGRNTETDAEGRFRAGPFSANDKTRIEVHVQNPEFAFKLPEPSGLRPGQVLDLGEIPGSRKATLLGHVIDEQGKPVRRGSISSLSGNAQAAIQPDGSFELKGLSAGKHKIRVWVPGKPPSRSRGVEFEVEQGSRTEGIEIRVEKTRTIRGVALAEDGAPRAGVDVIAVRDGAEFPYPNESAGMAVSGDDGRFAIPGLLAGRYAVGLRGWDRGYRLLPKPEPVVVEAGAEGVELRVPIAGGIASGRVVSKRDGQPVRRFTVALIRYKFFLPNWEGRESRESDTGSFEVEVDDAGSWGFEIAAAGHAPFLTPAVRIGKGKRVDLGEIRLGEAGRVAGRVTDHAGRDVGWTRIHMISPKLETSNFPYTRPNGRFVVEDVRPGAYTLFAVSPRHPLALVRDIKVEEGRTTRVDVRFKSSTPLTLRLLDDKGQPLQGAELVWTFPELFPFNSKMARGYEPPGYGANSSDADGMIRKPFLPAGEVSIEIHAEGYRLVMRKLQLRPGEPMELEIPLQRDK